MHAMALLHEYNITYDITQNIGYFTITLVKVICHEKKITENLPDLSKVGVFNRPGVAGAVLKTPSSLADSVSQ